jgi:uroporphyrinogen-III decarboxylase
MTSRERVLEAIRHRLPDKVPVDMSATPSSGISAMDVPPQNIIAMFDAVKEFNKH